MDPFNTEASGLSSVEKGRGFQFPVSAEIEIRLDIEQACFAAVKGNQQAIVWLWNHSYSSGTIKITEPRFLDSYIAEEVNERFAVFVVYSIIFELEGYSTDDLNKLYKKMDLSEEKQYSYLSKLIYAFRYRAISLDAMLSIVEGLTKESFTLAFEEKL